MVRSDLRKIYRRPVQLGFNYVFDPPLREGAQVAVTDRFGQNVAKSPGRVPAEPPFDPASLNDGLSTAVPPRDLIFLVVGHRDPQAFAVSRRPAVDFLLERLQAAGVDVSSLRTILDFGCGCGRVLAGWEHVLPAQARLIGCDINPRLIAFCQAQIPFARTFVSKFRPPLEGIQSGEIDFAYAASVFTHLEPADISLWSKELARIIRPGGHLLLSFHGAGFDDVVARISDTGPEQLKATGIYTHLHSDPRRTSPGSNDYATFMTQSYVADAFPLFEPVEMLAGSPNAFMAGHDIVVFRRR